jgi:hypothetical protein
MDAFNYLSVMVSLVLGLGMTQLFAGIGNMVQIRRRVSPYWLHSIWIGLLIALHIQMWWSFWAMRAERDWTYGEFAFVLVGPATLCIASHAFLPELIDGTIDVKKHYYDARKVFFGMLIVAAVWGIVIEPLMGLRPLLIPFRLVQVTGIGLMVACALSSNPRVHVVSTLLITAMLAAGTVLTRYRLGQTGLE